MFVLSREKAVVGTNNVVLRMKLLKAVRCLFCNARGTPQQKNSELEIGGMEECRDKIRPNEIVRERFAVEKATPQVYPDAVIEDCRVRQSRHQLIIMICEVDRVRIAKCDHPRATEPCVRKDKCNSRVTIGYID